jgi:hypothetical protein
MRNIAKCLPSILIALILGGGGAGGALAGDMKDAGGMDGI